MIRVVLADDEELVRAGLRLILAAAPDLSVVAEARDGAEAITAVARHRPDVVLMDIRMPEVDGLAATRVIMAGAEPPKVVILTTFDLDRYVHAALVAGAVGFLLKDTPPRDLAAAVRTVAAGHATLAPTVTRRLIRSYTERTPDRAVQARARLAALTERERQVAIQVGRGLSNADIGHRLGMRETTVKAHVSHALTRLGLDNRVQVAILVYEADLPTKD